jgi:hypothetical protein
MPQKLLLGLGFSSWVLDEHDIKSLKFLQFFSKHEMGYYTIQRKKPFTLGVALNDSPVGLLAWIGEKLRTFK